jgi:SAM-dependent methyltransferase
MSDSNATVEVIAEIDDAAHDGMVPPKHMWTMVGGGENFIEEGRALVDSFIERKYINPYCSVLDIGCGLGKHAIHLAAYLKLPGNYEGFDVEPLRIYWCNKAIAARHDNVHFQHFAIHSALYNPSGNNRADNHQFPYESEKFDFVFLGSVFTHMFDSDVRNYIGEIARVLKPGGRCWASFYLTNETTKQNIAAGTSAFTFAIPHRGCWIEMADPPDAAVAHEESRVLEMIAAAGLTPGEPISYGAWSRSRQQSQDIIVFGKPPFLSRPIPDLPANFNSARYLELDPDVAQAGVDAAVHWREHGCREGRRWQ